MKIRFENVCYQYNSKLPHKKQALKDINLEISEGEFIGIIGSSGSGKTTLLQHFTGLLRPTSGKIRVDGQDIWSKNYPLNELRKRIGLVFQFPENQLFEETVYSDVAFGPVMLKLSDDEIKIRVNEALKLVGMNDEGIKNRSPHQLSEGEKRRVAIAGVLAMAPEVLVLDEPTACLDPAGVKRINHILRQLHMNGRTIIMITHNLDVVIQLAQRIIILNNGEIWFDGTRENIFNDTKFLKSVNLDIPRMIRLCQFLQKMEVVSKGNFFSIDEIRKQIKKKFHRLD
jgi:energy-coupling factor transport system ATP-binding protein